MVIPQTEREGQLVAPTSPPMVQVVVTMTPEGAVGLRADGGNAVVQLGMLQAAIGLITKQMLSGGPAAIVPAAAMPRFR